MHASISTLEGTLHLRGGRSVTNSIPSDGAYGLVRIDTTDHLIHLPPNVRVICEPLMGMTSTEGSRKCAVYPTRERRIELYEKALDVVERWHARPGHEYVMRDNLFILGLYRRQVSSARAIRADVRLFELARAILPELTTKEWALLEERMPVDTRIRVVCTQERILLESCKLAAE